MLSEGTLLGRYRVDGLAAVAAVGGMGAVYRGTDTVLEHAVALKVLPADKAGTPGMAERFACESLQAAALSHPHVLPVYDAGEAEGVSYVAMQWVDGATLEQIVADDGPLDVERAVAVTAAVAAALDHAHEHGLVHRDIKPGNVMVDADGHAYLMDFGLSVRVDRSSALTRTGEFLATVDYAPPEQIQAAEVDRRADVYALAGLAFRCLTGRVPFERDSPVARLYAHLNDEPPAAHELRPAVPPAASETIRRGLAKRPDDRPPTAGAFAAELRAAIGDGPRDTVALAAVPATATADASPASRRGRRVLAGAAATVLAAFGGMSLAGITGGSSPTGDVPAAGADPGRERGAATTGTVAGTSATATEATVEHRAGETRREGRDKDERKDRRDGSTTEDERPDDRGSSTPEDPQRPSGATPAPPSSPASTSSPSSSAAPATTTGSEPAGTTPTETQPAQTTPTQTTPTETTPTGTTPTETTPTETTPTQTTPAATTPTETTPGG